MHKPFHLAMLIATAIATVPTQAEPTAQPVTDWIQLFNGRDLTGWQPKITGHKLGDNFNNTFRVEDGLLTVSYENYDRLDGRFGHLFHVGEYSSYILRIEYRFVGEQLEGGAGWAYRNSGVMIHAQAPETMRIDQAFPVSIEVQFLGGDDTGERPTANLCTPGTHVTMDGDLHTAHCTDSSSRTCRGSEWVTVEVAVRDGTMIEHRLDGKVVMAYTDPILDENDADAKRLIAARTDGDITLTSGMIALQSESHPIQFRRVELKVLADEGPR